MNKHLISATIALVSGWLVLVLLKAICASEYNMGFWVGTSIQFFYWVTLRFQGVIKETKS